MYQVWFRYIKQFLSYDRISCLWLCCPVLMAYGIPECIWLLFGAWFEHWGRDRHRHNVIHTAARERRGVEDDVCATSVSLQFASSANACLLELKRSLRPLCSFLFQGKIYDLCLLGVISSGPAVCMVKRCTATHMHVHPVQVGTLVLCELSCRVWLLHGYVVVWAASLQLALVMYV